MSKLQLRTKFMIMIGGILFVSMICAFLLYKLSNRRTIEEMTLNEMQSLAKTSSTAVELKIESVWNSLYSFSLNKDLRDQEEDIDKKVELLKKYSEKISAECINFADETGYVETDEDAKNIKDEAFFQTAMNGEMSVSNYELYGDKAVVKIGVPVEDEGKIKGVIYAIVQIDNIKSAFSNAVPTKKGVAYIIDEDGDIVMSTSSNIKENTNATALAGKDESYKGRAEFEKSIMKKDSGNGKYEEKKEEIYAGFAAVNDMGWSVIVSTNKEEVLKYGNLDKVFFISVLIFAPLVLFISFVVVGMFVKPVKTVTQELGFMANGDFSREIPSKLLLKKDEAGKLAGAMQRMQFSISGAIRDVKTEAEVVDGNVQNQQERINLLLQEIEGISSTTQELSSSSIMTAETTQQLATTAESIGHTVDHVAKQADNALETVKQIKERAEELKNSSIEKKNSSTAIFDETQTQLREALDKATAVEKINALSNTILSIAEETNLLALNASIEAARAGDAGKGFAVVATEISKLADNSKNSAAQIQSVTNEVISSVENLSACASGLLSYLDTTILKDYNTLVRTGEQYNDDAIEIQRVVSEFRKATNELDEKIDSMIRAIDEVARANNESAKGTGDIAVNANSVVVSANEVVNYTNETLDCTRKLDGVTNVFKLS